MKVDFNVVLKDLNSKDMLERAGVDSIANALLEAGVSNVVLNRALGVLQPFLGTGEDAKEVKLTAARVVANALQAPDSNLGGAERVDRMRLAIKCMDGQPVEISEQEKTKILGAIEKAYPGPLVYFRMHELFEQAAAPKEAAAA